MTYAHNESKTWLELAAALALVTLAIVLGDGAIGDVVAAQFDAPTDVGVAQVACQVENV